MLDVRCRADQRVVVIELRGEVSAATAPVLSRCLEAAFDVDARQVVVDLTAVDTFEEVGMQVLAEARARCGASGRSFDLRSANATTVSILELFEVSSTDSSAGTLLGLDAELRSALELSRRRMSDRPAATGARETMSP